MSISHGFADSLIQDIASGGTITGDFIMEGDMTVTGDVTFGVDQTVEGQFIIDVTNTEALLVRKNSDGGDVLVVDTTNETVEITQHNGTNKGLMLGAVLVTSTAAELNILDGVSSTAAELNILDGVTSTAAELNILDGVTSTAAELNLIDGSSAGTIVNSKAVIYGSSGEVNATTLKIAGTAITSTAAEINNIDGDTSATSTTLADADRVVVNDGGTMKQVALTDFETYMETSLDTLSSVTTLGAVNAGSITSGFGAIDIGSSALSTTGSVTLGATTFGDNDITNVGDINVDSVSSDDGSGFDLVLDDNKSAALEIKESSNVYMTFVTTNSGEKIQIDKALDINAVSDFGTNAMTNVNIDSGAIDGSIIGAASAAAGSFTTITASTSLDVTGSAGIILQNDETITNSTNGTVTINGIVAAGTGSAAGVFQSSGDYDATLQTGNSTTGSITITDGANGNIAITPNGSGEVDITKVDIAGGEIDATAIGANSASTAAFTTATASGDVNFDSGTFYVDASESRVGIGTGDNVDNLFSVQSTDLGTGWLRASGNRDETISISADDSSIDIVSNNAGTWGSMVQLKEVNSTTFVDNWALVRQSGASGDSGLYIRYGTSSFVDGSGSSSVDALAFTTAGAATFAGNVGVGGNLTVTGTSTFNGGTITLGDAAGDTIAFGGTITGNLVFEGSSDDAHELTLSPGDPGGDVTVTLPVATDTLVGKATTDTFTNKSIDLGTNTLTGSLAEFNSALQSESFVSLTGAETLTNKTLTSPKIGTSVLDTGGNELFKLTATGSAVNEFTVANAATGGAPTISATGGDSNIDITITPKGTGEVNIAAGNLNYAGTAITSTGAELNILDGVTSTAAELNIMDGVTSTAAEINLIDGGTARGTTAIADGDGVLINDDGTMRMTTVQTLATYMESEIDTFANLEVTTELQTALIAYTDGDDAITIADGGGITAAAGITSTAAANTLGATSFNDAAITNVGDIALDSISADGTDINIAVTDNSATALTIKQGSDAYLIVDTANSSESVSLGTGISGTIVTIGHSTSETTVADNLSVTGNVTISGNLLITGDSSEVKADDLVVDNATIAMGTTDGAAPSADSGFDIGLMPHWHTGSGAKTAFLGVDVSTSASAPKLTYIPDASYSSNVVSGTAGIIVADLEGTVTTAAQASITSLGDLTALVVDDVAINGKVVTMTGSADDTAVFTVGTHGTLSIVTTDTAAAAGNITITADGTFEADGTTITLDSAGDIDLNAAGGDVFLKAASTTYGSLTNTSGNLIIKSGTTTAATFSGANVTLAGTVGSGAITSTGVVTGTGFTIGSAAILEAELEILDGASVSTDELNTLDGITAVVGELNALDIGATAVGTAVASKAVILDSNKDFTGVRNLTISGELDAATLDISGAIDVAGTTNLDVVDIDGAVDMASTLTMAGKLFINQDSNVSSLEIDTEATTGIGIFIDTPATTSVPVLKIADCDSLTTGQVAYFHSNASNSSSRNIVEIVNNNASATGGTGLRIHQGSSGYAMDVRSKFTSAADAGAKLRLHTDDTATMASGHRLGVLEFAGAEDGNNNIITGARIEALTTEAWDASNNDADLLFYTTSGNASQSEQMRITSGGNVGIGDTDPSEAKLSITGVASGDYGIMVDQDQNAHGINIDCEAADYYGLFVTGKYAGRFAQDISGGSALDITRNLSEGGSNPLVNIADDNDSNTQPALKIQQDGAGHGISIDQNGNNPAIYIDTEATGNHGIVFDSPAQTAGAVLLINDCDALTSGSAMQVQCASGSLATTANAGVIMVNYTGNSTAASNLLYLKNDHVDADATVGLKIKQDGAAASIELEGNGSIKFPGSQGASSDANSLDDYEEGTWTPTMQIDTTSITSSGGVYSATGKYTKVGNLVHLQMTWKFGDTITIPSGTYWRIAGFPFSINIENYASVLMANWEAQEENIYGGAVTYHASSTIYIKKVDGTNFSSTVPTTWATGDELSLIGTHLV